MCVVKYVLNLEDAVFNGKNILITGGTGSFGKKFTQCILKNYKPNKIVVLSRDEFKQYKMQQEFDKYNELRFFLGDVRDKDRLHRAFHEIDYVIHAAALKQVPAAEYNPFEAVKTNIIGAQNVIEASIDNKVEKVVALSTDKAANPLNLYGATKLCSDKLFVAGNAYTGGQNTTFAVVRYGNVLGSRGSVVPLFLKQKETGVLTITDKRMTRFWITLEQAVQLVGKVFYHMTGGEVFVPKIPSMNMLDMARAIAPDAEIKEIGIRPGEKLHEVMVPSDDARHTVELNDYYVILPEFSSWGNTFEKYENNKIMEEGFCYSSDINNQQLTAEELLNYAKKLKL